MIDSFEKQLLELRNHARLRQQVGCVEASSRMSRVTARRGGELDRPHRNHMQRAGGAGPPAMLDGIEIQERNKVGPLLHRIADRITFGDSMVCVVASIPFRVNAIASHMLKPTIAPVER